MENLLLHNWLLEVDGLAVGWEHGVQSDWETQADNYDNVPFAIKRLKSPGIKRDVRMPIKDLSGIGHGNDVQASSTLDDEDEDINLSQELPDIESIKKMVESHFTVCQCCIFEKSLSDILI